MLRLQIQLRKATLICEEAVQKAERDILLDAGSKEERESELRHRSRDSLVHSANNVTENLVHIREMMATSLDQSETTTEVLGKYWDCYNIRTESQIQQTDRQTDRSLSYWRMHLGRKRLEDMNSANGVVDHALGLIAK